jgi:hypothetical protein
MAFVPEGQPDSSHLGIAVKRLRPGGTTEVMVSPRVSRIGSIVRGSALKGFFGCFYIGKMLSYQLLDSVRSLLFTGWSLGFFHGSPSSLRESRPNFERKQLVSLQKQESHPRSKLTGQ